VSGPTSAGDTEGDLHGHRAGSSRLEAASDGATWKLSLFYSIGVEGPGLPSGEVRKWHYALGC